MVGVSLVKLHSGENSGLARWFLASGFLPQCRLQVLATSGSAPESFQCCAVLLLLLLLLLLLVLNSQDPSLLESVLKSLSDVTVLAL